MDAGLLVVLAAIGFFVLVPLWFAWLSLDSRRWGRVERVLGREPSGGERGMVGGSAGLSVVYLANGTLQLLAGRSPWVGLIWLLGGLLFAVTAGLHYRRWRRHRQRAGSAGAQVQHGPEAGGPGAGGGGGH
jgi:heme A synthase